MSTQWTLATHVDICTSGEDSPVLVLGHSLGSSHVMWDALIPALTGTFTVIRFDLPGHEGSQPAPIDEPLTMDALLGALERSLDELGVQRFHLAGLSIGGLITLAGAQRWGSGSEPRLLSATSMASGPKNGTHDMWVERAALIREQGTEALVEVTLERWFTPEFHNTHAEDVDRIRQAFIGCADEGYAQCCEILSTTNLTEGMPSITVPLTIINGTHDAGFDDNAAQALAASAENAPKATALHINARHMCAMEEPHTVASALLTHA